MPMYEFKCPECEAYIDKFLPLSDYLNVPECCDKPMDRLLSAPAAIIQDNTCYRSQIDGQMITSRRQHRTHLKDHGCIEVGNEKIPGPRALEAPAGLKETIIETVNNYKQKRK